MAAVEESPDGSLLFPPTIPRPRGSLINKDVLVILGTYIVISAIIFCVVGKTHWIHCQGTFLIAIMLYLLSEMLYRCTFLRSEREHLQSRYNNSQLTMLTHIFSINWQPFALTSFLLLIMYSLSYNPLDYLNSTLIVSIFGAYLCSRLLAQNESPLQQSIRLNDMRQYGLDFGSSMAHSFFHGYLNIVLPNNGTEQKGIKENMEDYEDREGIRFDVKKLFILIPLSCNCFVSLDEFDNIEKSKNLESILLTRAGVQSRVYKNSVYKIMKKQKKVYVAVEYATPLRTMQDIISNSGHPHSVVYKNYKKEITLQFFLTLRDILQKTKSLSGVCELIYFDDEDHRREPVKVNEVILRRIKKLKKMM